MVQGNDIKRKEDNGKQAIILIGHGSRAAGADDDMERIAKSLKGMRGGIVELCRMARRRPLFAEALENCIRQGAKEIIVIPYFLHFGVHLRQDIPEMLREAVAQHPEIRLVLGRHLGYDNALVTLVEQRIGESEELCDIRELSPAPIDHRPDKTEWKSAVGVVKTKEER